MSAPDTDTEEQEKRHKPTLMGMAAAVGFALILLFVLIVWVVGQGNEPEGADVVIDGRTGEAEIVDE